MFTSFTKDSPCDTAGLEQLRVNGILNGKLPGVTIESSQCLLFILLVAVVIVDVLLLPQLPVEPAGNGTLLAVNKKLKFDQLFKSFDQKFLGLSHDEVF